MKKIELYLPVLYYLFMRLKAWGETDVGLKRSNNQDSILVDSKLGLFIVADGMGGHKGGEVASAIAVEVAKEILTQEIEKPHFTPRDVIQKIYREASARIHHMSTIKNPELAGMGTTMVLAFFHHGTIYLGNVGDSRCYLLHHENLWQLTEDHSLVNEQLRAGVIGEEDIGLIVGRNVITRSVGYEREVRVDIVQRDLEQGESLLLCSDGLCGLVRDEEIIDVCRRYSGKDVVKQCVEVAKRAGGDDNISVIYIQTN